MSSATNRNHAHSVCVTIPIHTVSESNAREHWAKKAARVRDHRGWTRAILNTVSFRRGWQYLTVTMTRVAPRALDDDNLRGALKACRDGIADRLGIDDRDERVCWKYAQRKGKPREYSVMVDIE